MVAETPAQAGAIVAVGEVQKASGSVVNQADIEQVKKLLTQTKAIGVILPPPDIRAIVDKTAQFVAKNGELQCFLSCRRFCYGVACTCLCRRPAACWCCCCCVCGPCEASLLPKNQPLVSDSTYINRSSMWGSQWSTWAAPYSSCAIAQCRVCSARPASDLQAHSLTHMHSAQHLICYVQ